MHYEAFVNVLKKIYRGVLNSFAKTLKLENYYKVVIRVMLRKKNKKTRSRDRRKAQQPNLYGVSKKVPDTFWG